MAQERVGICSTEWQTWMDDIWISMALSRWMKIRTKLISILSMSILRYKTQGFQRRISKQPGKTLAQKHSIILTSLFTTYYSALLGETMLPGWEGLKQGYWGWEAAFLELKYFPCWFFHFLYYYLFFYYLFFASDISFRHFD